MQNAGLLVLVIKTVKTSRHVIIHQRYRYSLACMSPERLLNSHVMLSLLIAADRGALCLLRLVIYSLGGCAISTS